MYTILMFSRAVPPCKLSEHPFYWGDLIALSQWVSTEEDSLFLPPTPRAFGNIWRDFFWLLHLGIGSAGIQWVEVKDGAEHPTMHRIDPTTAMNDPAPNINSAWDCSKPIIQHLGLQLAEAGVHDSDPVNELWGEVWDRHGWGEGSLSP